MKPLVTIAAVCIILIFAWFVTCTYQIGKAFSDVDEAFTETSNNFEPSKFNCQNDIITLIDRISNDTTFGNSDPIVADSNSSKSIKIQVKRLNRRVLQFVCKSSFSCIDENDLIYLIYKDGSFDKFNNAFEFNCDGEAIVYFDNYKSSKKLASIKRKELQAIRISRDGEIVEADLTINSSQHFKAVLDCLTN